MDKTTKKIFLCLPYRGNRDPYTMVYAGVTNPNSDGDILCVTYENGRPVKFELVHEEEQLNGTGAASGTGKRPN
jgi:hypothetical protein